MEAVAEAAMDGKRAVAAGLALALGTSYANEQHSPTDTVILDGFAAWSEARADEEGDPLTDLGAFWRWRVQPGMAKDGPSTNPQRVRSIADKVAAGNPLVSFEPVPTLDRLMATNDWYRDSAGSGRTWRPDPAADPRHRDGIEAGAAQVLVVKGGAQGSSNPGAGARVWDDLGTEFMDYRMFAHSAPRDWQQQGVMHSGRMWPTHAPPLHVLQKRGQCRPPGSPRMQLQPADRARFLEEKERAGLTRLGVAMDSAKTNQLKQQLLQQALTQSVRHEKDAAAAPPATAEETARHLVESLASVWKDRQLASNSVVSTESAQETNEQRPERTDIGASFAQSLAKWQEQQDSAKEAAGVVPQTTEGIENATAWLALQAARGAVAEDEPGVFGSVQERGDHAEALLHAQIVGKAVLKMSHEKVPLRTPRDGDPHKQAALSTARAVRAMDLAGFLAQTPGRQQQAPPERHPLWRPAAPTEAEAEAELEHHFPGMFTPRGASGGGSDGSPTPRPPSKPSGDVSAAIAWAAAQGDYPGSARPFTRPAPRKVHVPALPPRPTGVLGLPLECTAAGLQDALTPRRTSKQQAGGGFGVRRPPRKTTDPAALVAWASTIVAS